MRPTTELTDPEPRIPLSIVASEARYRRLFEAARDGILILDGYSGRIVDANPFMEQLLEYSHARLVGKELWQLGWFNDVTESKLAFRELLQNGYIRYDDLPLKTSSGKNINVEFVSNVYLVDNARIIQCNIRDISLRKQKDEALIRSERLNRNLVEHLPHRILIKDADSVILFCNANYAKYVGIPAEQIVGKTASAFFPPEVARSYHDDDQGVLLHGVTKEIDAPYTIAGREGWMHTIKVPYRDEQGRVVGVLVILEEITERKQLEEQLRQSQKMEAIGLLAGGVAHDFNNLLTGILGYCELISSGLGKDDPLAADVEQIRICGQRATSLTRQLLAFSRKQDLEIAVLDLNALVVGLDGMLRRIVGEDIEIRTVLAPNLGRIKADPGQIGQVIMNLLVNARDAMPSGGTFTIETANVDLDTEYTETHFATVAGPYVLLAVSDNGCGMEAAILSRMFEPFFTTKEQGKGTGLGLATVFGIVKQSGGNIWCYSEPGLGTTFRIYLPRVGESTAPVVSDDAIPVPRGHETVLVAEDDEAVRTLIVKMLTIDGYATIATRSGTEALRELARPDRKIDLLISDMVMPGMSGLELAQQLLRTRPTLKVLLVSGYTGDTVRRHDMAEEGANFLAKPFSRLALSRKVREILDTESRSDVPPPGA